MTGPLRVALRAEDRRRVVLALTAFTIGDRPAFDAVLNGVTEDAQKTTALVLGVIEYAVWVAAHTGPLLEGDDGPGAA